MHELTPLKLSVRVKVFDDVSAKRRDREGTAQERPGGIQQRGGQVALAPRIGVTDARWPGVALAVREVPKRVGLVRGLDTLMGLT